MNDPYTEDHNYASEPPTPRPPLMLGFGFLPRLQHPSWTEFVILYLKRCPKYYLKTAILLAAGLTLPIVNYAILIAFYKSNAQHHTFTGLFDIFMMFGPTLIGMLICTVVCLMTLFWGLASILVALTATCRSFLIIDPQHFRQDPAALDRAIDTAQDEGANLFRHRKAYLATVWLMYSVFMLLPSFVMCASGAMVLLGMPQIGAYTMLPTRIDLPLETMLGSAIALGVSIIVLSNYALILMPYSAITEHGGVKAAAKALLLSLKILPAISIYSVIFFVISSFLSSPIDLLLLYNQEIANSTIAQVLCLLLKAIWHVAFFVYLAPMSLLIPCEMIRGNTDN